MDLNLKDKVALVTGASRGLGKAICLSLAAEGVKVAVNYRQNPEKAQAVVDQIQQKFGTEAITVLASVSNENDVISMFSQVHEKLGTVDILVNNAAVCPTGWVSEMPTEEWTQTIDINLNGTFLTSRQFVKTLLAEKKTGRIINIVSQAAFRGSTSGHAPYDASKGGIVSFTIALARELAPHGITVNAVAPGLIMTGMIAEAVKKNKQKYVSRVPLGRIAEPEEIANVVTFLSSDRAAYMTGATVDVTGGMLMR